MNLHCLKRYIARDFAFIILNWVVILSNTLEIKLEIISSTLRSRTRSNFLSLSACSSYIKQILSSGFWMLLIGHTHSLPLHTFSFITSLILLNLISASFFVSWAAWKTLVPRTIFAKVMPSVCMFLITSRLMKKKLTLLTLSNFLKADIVFLSRSAWFRLIRMSLTGLI